MAAVSLSFAGAPLPRLRAHPDRARSKPLNVPASLRLRQCRALLALPLRARPVMEARMHRWHRWQCSRA